MKYWAYMKGEVPGSYEPAELVGLPGFSMTTLVCPGEGEIAEKNWRRAGEFHDIIRAHQAREATAPPPAPLGAPPTGSEVDALLDTASTRLFSHVADLMKELETRRDEKSLIVSLQRQISALKEELNTLREEKTMYEMRMPRIAELEEAQRKDHAALTQLQAKLTERENQVNEARVVLERFKIEHEAAKRRVQETENDLGIRNRLVDKLSHDLSEKELSLAKSLGVIRRLEEDLNKLCPSPDLLRPAAAPARPAPAPAPRPAPVEAKPLPEIAPLKPIEPIKPIEPVKTVEPVLPMSAAPAEPAPKQILSVPELKTPVPPPPSTFTNDEPPQAPPYLEPHQPADTPKAQQALMTFLRKVFPGQPH